MTVEPASTRANRINSDSLDGSYIGISLMVGHSTSAARPKVRPGWTGETWRIVYSGPGQVGMAAAAQQQIAHGCAIVLPSAGETA